MEAAWEFYHGDLDDRFGSYIGSFGNDFRQYMREAAAVDECHRYTLEPVKSSDDPFSTEAPPMVIKTWPT
jgi:hypothetical protein